MQGCPIAAIFHVTGTAATSRLQVANRPEDPPIQGVAMAKCVPLGVFNNTITSSNARILSLNQCTKKKCLILICHPEATFPLVWSPCNLTQ